MTIAPERPTDRRILITGGAGFIGSRLARTFASRNDVTVFDRRQPSAAHSSNIVCGDVTDLHRLNGAAVDQDAILHQAACIDVQRSIEDPRPSTRTNVSGTLNVLEAARLHDLPVVIASSAAVYGESEPGPISESTPPNPTSPYGLDKLTCERYGAMYADLYDLPVTNLRYFNVYGPGPRRIPGVVRTFLRTAHQDGRITIHGDGSQTRDFVHIDDVCRANALALTRDGTGESINIGSGRAVAVRELAREVSSLVEHEVDLDFTERPPGDIDASHADLERAEDRLGYRPRVALDEGLRSLLPLTAVEETSQDGDDVQWDTAFNPV